MSSIVSEPPFRKNALRGLLEQRDIWLAFIAVLALAVLTRHAVIPNVDVSWGFTMAEKLLAGERPYVDFIEPNPPSYIYLHLPAVIVAHWIGLSPELVMDWLVFIAIGGSLWLSGRILLRANLLQRFDSAMLLALVMTIVAVLPAQTFAEREHIAIVLFLPMLAAMLVRATGGKPSWSEIVIAGVGAGAMMVLKPHLALGLAATVAMAAFSARCWTILVAMENWIAAAVVAAYGGAIALAYPEFLSATVPLLLAVYVPIRNSLWDMLVRLPAVPIWITSLLALVLLRRSEPYDRVYGILLAASVGFAGSWLVQGKGWAYHSYPMLALALIALACAMSERRAQERTPLERGGWAIGAGFLAYVAFIWMNVGVSLTSLVAPIRQIKPHPTMLAISYNIGVGHPLVRQVGGTWVGGNPSLWITGGAEWRRAHQPTPEERAELDRYVALDRAMLVDALRNRKPDVIVIQKVPMDFEKWARADREIDDLLKPYREAVTTSEMLVLRRDGS
jgi:hypothetical protein